ncbi:MAG: hypothetical protein WCO25_06350 [Candidatus Uhrbacteria bacterium]
MVRIHFYFSPHGSARDIRGIEKWMRRADAYVPELFGWTDWDLRVLQAVSNGTRRPVCEGMKVAEMSSPAQYQATLLYGTKKRVFFADVPAAQAEWYSRLVRRADREMQSARRAFVEGRYEDAIGRVHSSLTVAYRENQRREERMADRIVTVVTAMTRREPLRSKANVLVLVRLGQAHLGVYERVRDTFSGTVTMTETSADHFFAARALSDARALDDPDYLARVLAEDLVVFANDELLPRLSSKEKILRVTERARKFSARTLPKFANRLEVFVL